MATQGELFLEFVAHFSPKKADVNPLIVDLTEMYIRNSEEKEFKKHMVFTGRLAKFLLDELKKEREHTKQLVEENKILQDEILRLKCAKEKQMHRQSDDSQALLNMDQIASRLPLL